MFLPEHKKAVYLPHLEYRLITALYSLACEGLIYCLYKRYFDSIKVKFQNKSTNVWYVHTVNAYHDLAISHWCKIFGSYSEPTHYYQLIKAPALNQGLIELNINPPDRKKLKEYLLKGCGLSSEEFNNYHQLTKNYRDRNLVHREHSPNEVNDGDLQYPKLDISKKTFMSLILILIKLAKKFPDTQDSVSSYKFIYDDFDDQYKICELIKESFPEFD